MIWLTWRQFRAQAITAAAALAAFAIVLAITGSHLSSTYNSSGLATCHGGTCAGLASTFLSNLASGGGFAVVPGSDYMILYFLSILVILIAPAVIGTFWGAPLIAHATLGAAPLTIALTLNPLIRPPGSPPSARHNQWMPATPRSLTRRSNSNCETTPNRFCAAHHADLVILKEAPTRQGDSELLRTQ
jgi:hypothetical protein